MRPSKREPSENQAIQWLGAENDISRTLEERRVILSGPEQDSSWQLTFECSPFGYSLHRLNTVIDLAADFIVEAIACLGT
jgi:hypothetical protein